MLAFVGYVFLALGVASALPLLLNPFGVMQIAVPWVPWVSYPVFLIAGLLVASLGSKAPGIARMFRTLGAILLFLGCAAALGLAAGVIGIFTFENNMLSLVYVLVSGIVFGVLGLVANYPAGKRTEAPESARQ